MLYPLKFIPILKHILWGGTEIYQYKNIPVQSEKTGESWEISVLPENVSVITNGVLKGKSLIEAIDIFKEDLLGKKVTNKFGFSFPLLVKFIDANQDLSIQVHPNDELAQVRHNSFGKTEMWYVISAKENAHLYSGFAKEITPETYEKTLKDNTFMEYLQKYHVNSGDVFFLPAGTVHAIGSGCFIVEIQQSSNITYRIFDYNRKDKNGNKRELHTELAKDAIDYQVCPKHKNKCSFQQEVQSLVKSSYFTTNLIEGKKGQIIHLSHSETFIIYICISGRIKLTDNSGNSVDMKQGETVLIPAKNGHLITIEIKENSKLLETYLDS